MAETKAKELAKLASLAPTKGRLLVGDGSDWVAVGVGADNQVPTADASDAEGVVWQVPHLSTAILQYQEANGVASETYTAAGGWETVSINTEDSDLDGIVSISTNQFTPVAGTYRVSGWAVVFNGSSGIDGRARIYNVTGTSVVVQGSNSRNGNVATTDISICDGVLVANGTDAFELQIDVDTNSVAIPALSNGSPEVYAQVTLMRIG